MFNHAGSWSKGLDWNPKSLNAFKPHFHNHEAEVTAESTCGVALPWGLNDRLQGKQLALCLAHSKCLINAHAYRNIWRLSCSLAIWQPIKIPAQPCFFPLPPKPPMSMSRICLSSLFYCLFKKIFPLSQKFCLPLPPGLSPLATAPPPPSPGQLFTSSLAVLRIQNRKLCTALTRARSYANPSSGRLLPLSEPGALETRSPRQDLLVCLITSFANVPSL